MIALPAELPKLIHESNGTECGKNDSSSASATATTSISQHAISSKVRPVSKLSSRHRRKRRGYPENEDLSAKRNKERIPIPAFTSIPSEYYDLGAGRDEGESAPSVPCGSLSSEPLMPTTPSVCRADTDPCLASAEASIVKRACMDNVPIKQPDVVHMGEQIKDAPDKLTRASHNEGLRCAKCPSDVGQSNASLQIGHPPAHSSSSFVESRNASEGVLSVRNSLGETLVDAAMSLTTVVPPESNNNSQSSARLIGNIASTASISLTSVAALESNNDMTSSARAASSTHLSRYCIRTGIEQRDDRTIGDLVYCQLGQTSSVNRDGKCAGLLKEKELKVEMSRPELSIHPNNSFFDELNSFVYEESSSSLVEKQAIRVIDLCSNDDTDNMSKGKNEKQSRSGYFNPMGTGPSDSIVFVHDSHGDGRAVGDMSNSAAAVKNEKPNKSVNAKAQGKRKTVVRASSKENLNASKNSEGGAIIAQTLTRSRNETCTRTKSGGDAAKKKQSKSSAGKKKLCSACSNCDCTDVTSHKLPTLSGSDARQEQSLINRLQRLEREIAWKEGQRHDVARALKKHQLKMLKKWGDSHSVSQKQRFLADVEMSDEVGCPCPIVGSGETNCAKTRVFGKQKTEQPTLTQMVRDQTRDDDLGDEPSTVDNAHDDFLSFWTNTDPIPESTQRFGTMSYFKNALANYKGMKSIDHWAEATATTLHVEDQGFNALVTLFDESMEKNYSSSSSPSLDDDEDGCKGNELDHTTDPITLESERVASEIENSVRSDNQQLAAIERMCPNWAENIKFAQAHTDPDTLQRALHNVKQAAIDLETMKDRILRAFMDRHQTLEFFAKSIHVSRDRLDEKQGKDCPSSPPMSSSVHCDSLHQ
ncbi:hypothetical protein ACHAXH_005571, partial [Discostella pseudostelligera]